MRGSEPLKGKKDALSVSSTSVPWNENLARLSGVALNFWPNNRLNCRLLRPKMPKSRFISASDFIHWKRTMMKLRAQKRLSTYRDSRLLPRSAQLSSMGATIQTSMDVNHPRKERPSLSLVSLHSAIIAVALNDDDDDEKSSSVLKRFRRIS